MGGRIETPPGCVMDQLVGLTTDNNKVELQDSYMGKAISNNLSLRTPSKDIVDED